MKTNRLNHSLWSATILALSLSGCTTVNTVENAQKTVQRTMVSDARVITDPSLNRHVSIVGVNSAMTPGNLLQVQVELQNNTRSLYHFNYRFEWFDGNGMQINNVTSALIPDQIEGKESKFISGVAPSPACRDFRLKLIDGN